MYLTIFNYVFISQILNNFVRFILINILKVLMLKNEVNLMQIKSKNQEDIINIMKQEIEDFNNEHSNEIEQLKKELNNNQRLICHYKGNIIIYINNVYYFINI